MTHLETYLDVLKILPNEFQREYVLLGELDKKAGMIAHEIEVVQASILESAKDVNGVRQQNEPSIEDRLLHLRQLHQMSVDLQNEKYALAKQSRDMIVSYAQRLDDDIEVFKQEIPPEALMEENNMMNGGGSSSGGGGGGGGSSSSKMKGRGAKEHSSSHRKGRRGRDDDSSEEESEEEAEDSELDEEEEEYEERYVAQKAQKKSAGQTASSAAAAVVEEEAEGEGEAVEVDNTPYCICSKPSTGEMIACDAEGCPYQWFHLECLGLKKVPKGDFICDECKHRLAKQKK